EEYLQAFTY
nr:Chain C, EEYLQAFTY, self peptide from the ATP binding cassette protein ABCD3 [synthetic construct]3KPN_C Chain C, EEYLQAFTY, self peptide from the ATP binding cassette protein ABCD3 [synthetic construct]3KPP_C Chain C, EEYLQAFTY, self peptide from the ATP binding cassette protein ABCD3 [synthetic construct]3KPS_C Chain C, EEYLQAFTY, self peptide from the ATP binding cassette protein ABCD3 [synthetic construct]